jgi:hypothetical protein
MDPWEVMPAPFGLINPGRESGKTEWHWSWFSGVNLGRKLYFFANVRGHRCPGAGCPSRYNESEATHRLGRTAEGYSVDRIVRVLSFLSALTPAEMFFEKSSASSALGKWHRIEVYFFGVCVIVNGGIKPKRRFDGKEYISAKLGSRQRQSGK